MLWLFNLIWPKQRYTNFILAILFVIYPGFLWWTGGFEFQAYVLSLSLQVYSIVFTLKAIKSNMKWRQVVWTVSAILFGWGYLALVEYAIGMEIFRLLCVYLLVRRKIRPDGLWKSLAATIRASAVFLIIPLAFLTWYQFFFDNWRGAQNAGVQIGRLLTSPLTGLWAGIRLLQSTLNVALLAWFVPFQENFFIIRLKDMFIGILFAIIVVFVLYLVNYVGQDRNSKDTDVDSSTINWQADSLWVGFLGILAGVLPIVMANRSITFESFSHYALPASLPAVMFIGALIFSISPEWVQLFVLSVLLGIATLTHHAVAARSLNEGKAVIDFWWQVTWRVSSMHAGTTLAVVYPDMDYFDNSEYVWGPANFIYYPQMQSQSPLEVPISALVMNSESLKNILVGSDEREMTDKVITNTSMLFNYKNILIMTQPSIDSCVHIIDKRWPTISVYDGPFVIAASPKSQVEGIVTNSSVHVPPASIFGTEPVREWCYYFEKADMARQQGAWLEITRLGDEVNKLGFHPNDQIEWMPFLQAYALLGDQKKLKDISTRINSEKFYKKQACDILRAMPEYGYTLQPEMIRFTDELFCSEK